MGTVQTGEIPMNYPLPLQQFAAHVAQRPDANWLHQPLDRIWHSFSWAEVDDHARRIAAGLQHQGFRPGSRIAILARNCAEWFIADLAIMMAGMVSVPIYATAGRNTIEYILRHSGSVAIIVGKLDRRETVEEAIAADVLRIALPYPTVAANEQWRDWLQVFSPLQAIAEPVPGDTMTICYTSGSTGTPKGVVLSYGNFAAASHATIDKLSPQAGDRFLSYLPLAHITERSVLEIVSIAAGIEVYFIESLDTFAEDLLYSRPTCFVSVPRLWTRFQAQILRDMPNKKLQRLLRIPIANKIIASRIRKSMGLDQARLFGSGSAPISPAVLQWFFKLGIPISEGWGMTETTGLSCGNMPFERKHLGTIGLPVECIEMRQAVNGEVLVRGDAVFKEYYLDAEVTAASFTDGWFHTGDLAEIHEGAWKIVGQVKEQFKTGKGKYVAPVPIEALLAGEPTVEQVCVMGSGRKQPIALVVMSEGPESVDDSARRQLNSLLDRVNSQLEPHQRLDHILVCEESWTIENDLLTPTLKLRRNRLEAKYSGLLENTEFSKKILMESGLRQTVEKSATAT